MVLGIYSALETPSENSEWVHCQIELSSSQILYSKTCVSTLAENQIDLLMASRDVCIDFERFLGRFNGALVLVGPSHKFRSLTIQNILKRFSHVFASNPDTTRRDRNSGIEISWKRPQS